MLHTPPPLSLERLTQVEKKIAQAVELSGKVMEEIGNSMGPRTSVVDENCKTFMAIIKDIHSSLREEIKGMCDYRPYENCDYISRNAAEISVQKLDCVLSHVDAMEGILEIATRKL